MGEIWAILEHEQGILHEQSSELVSEAIAIARRQQAPTTVHAVVLTASHEGSPDTTLLSSLDIDTLDILGHSQLAHYTTEGYVSALAELMQQRAPTLVLTSATPNGRDWTPRLAAQLHLPFVANCLSLDIQEDALFALRAIYEGRAYVQTQTILHERTALATLIPGVRGVSAKQSGNLSPTFVINRYKPLLSEVHERVRRIALEAP